MSTPTLAYGAGSGSNVMPIPANYTIAAFQNPLTNQVAALTELNGNFRMGVDLTNAHQIRSVFRMNTGGASTAQLILQYSYDESSWATLTAAVPYPTAGTKVGPWQDIPVAAKGDVIVRIMVEGGDAIADPVFRNVGFQVR